jgi:hypothetical protein
MKKLALITLALSGLLWYGCNQKPKDQDVAKHEGMEEASHTDHEHGGHVYSCPMHSEVVSGKEGTCPKSSKTYKMNYTSMPAQLEANTSGTLSFRPVDPSNESALVPLDLVHEKKIHLIIVSKDLSYFEHVHPKYTNSGDYVIAVLPNEKGYKNGIGHDETTFPFGGEFIMFQDYAPTGAGHQLSRIPITVKGKAKDQVRFKEEKFGWQNNGYQVNLSFDKAEVKTNEPLGLKVNITKDGKGIANLDNYLGALGHMVVISENTEKYLHVHPMDSDTKGPDIQFHTSFDTPGIYRAFLQFKHEGKLQTADFTIKVK